MIHYVLAAALIATQSAGPAKPCLTRQEAGDIALTATSIGIAALAERCRPHVGATAFLNTGASAMLARLQAAAEPRRASAIAAFARMSRPVPAPPGGEVEAADGGDVLDADMNMSMDVDLSAEAEMTAQASAADAGDDMQMDIDSDGSDPTESDATDEVGPAMPEFDPAANPELMVGMMTLMATAMISSIDNAACPDASDFLEALSPLTPDHIARLAGAGLGMMATARPGATDNPLCPA